MVSSVRPAPLAAVSVRDDRDFAELFHAHVDLVWRLARRLGVGDDAVDDVVQEVFVVAQRKFDRIELGRERAFLCSTVVRVAASARRSKARRREAPEEIDDISDVAPSPAELVDRKRARALLDAIIAELDDDLRAVFVLYELENMTMADIALCLELPPGTVASRLRRARADFQASVARYERRKETR